MCRIIANPSQDSFKALIRRFRRKADHIICIPRRNFLFIELTRDNPAELRRNNCRSFFVASDNSER